MVVRVLHDILAAAAAACPEKTAVLHKDDSWTYGGIRSDCGKLADILAANGVRRGDRVAFYMEKRIEKVVAIFGISEAGGVFVPVRWQNLGPQVAHIVADSGTALLITTYARLSLLAEALKDMPTLKTVIAIGKPEEAKGAALPGVNVLDWTASMAHASKAAALPRVVEPDLAAILYTSGSTGKPKGVVLSHLNIVSGARIVSEFLTLTENDRLLSILTFGFDYGLNQLTTAFLNRAQIVLMEYLFPRDIVSAAKKHAVTGIAHVAAGWNLLVDVPSLNQETLPSLRYITNSGGAIPEVNVRRLRQLIPRTSIFLMYGLTEAFRSTFLDPALVDTHPTSMGKAIPGEEILIVDEHGKAVPPGGTGELVHRGVLVAQGYWNAPDLTAIRYKRNPLQPPEVPVPEMAVFSGDQVRIDAEGLLYFVGRKDEMIKVSGNRISPTEVEELLHTSGLARDAMALGVPHEVYGQTVYVVVVPAEGRAGLDATAVIDACKKAMPAYMVPQQVEIRESLPRNANGKVDRALIKKQVFEKLALPSK
ncbi:MAG: acyl-CoA ligase (AMP-forming), exosortase A system-associated [Fibrobacterota bacterium]|nr:acyl-CoA ligase (AMP-forming), exosortase A system-associated [Fibrobacterota bacterium]